MARNSDGQAKRPTKTRETLMRSSTLLITAAAVAIATAAVVALPAFADSKSYGLTGFDRVEVSAGVDVTLSQGPFSIPADEPDGKFDRLIVEIRGNTLRISRKNTWFDWSGVDYSVAVSAPNFVGLEVSSGAAVGGHNLSLRDLKV